MSYLPVLPILIPLATSVLCLALWRRLALQRVVSALGAVAALPASAYLLLRVNSDGILVAQMGGWEAPYGISIVADGLGAIMAVLTSFVGVCIVLYAFGAIDRRREAHGFHGLTHALLGACAGAFLSGDIFNIYVWFEVMLMSSFVLLTLGGERGQLEGAIKYVTLNLLSSVLFLSAIGLLYGMVGTLNLAHISLRLSEAGHDPFITVIALLFLVAFGIKAAAFPFFFWLPASYHTPPPVVSGLFAALLTKVGVYSIVRVFTLLFTNEAAVSGTVLLWIAGFGMLGGVLGAAAQMEIRRILSFHSVSQIGYMLMGLAIALVAIDAVRLPVEGRTAEEAERIGAAAVIGLAGTICFVLHHSIVKSNLFLISGIIERIRGTDDLKKLGGLYREHPGISVMFMLSAMSLAGIPLLTGFWAKLILVRAGLQAGTYVIVGVALFTGVLTLYSMTKIWAEAFWREPEGEARRLEVSRRDMAMMTVPVAVLAGLAVLMGVFSGPVYRVAADAGASLLDPSRYRDAVLGPGFEGVGEDMRRVRERAVENGDVAPPEVDEP